MACGQRLETMYGITNFWVSVTTEYVAFETIGGDVYISTQRSARIMAYQGVTKERGVVPELFHISGRVCSLFSLQ